MVSVTKDEVSPDVLRQVADEKAIPVLEYDEPLLIISLGTGWTMSLTFQEEEPVRDTATNGSGSSPPWANNTTEKIGESTCSWWKLSEDTIQQKGIEYVVAAYRGVTRALFRIKPDTWEETFEPDADDGHGRRIGWQFDIVDPATSSIKSSVNTGTGLEPRPTQNQRYWPW